MNEYDTLVVLNKISSSSHSLTSFLQQNREFSSNLIGYIHTRPSSKITHWLRQNFISLLSLQSEVNLEERYYLQQAMVDGATLSLPIGFNGSTPQSTRPLLTAIAQAELHWTFSTQTTQPDLQKVDISFLLSPHWTEQLCDIISGLLYQSQFARDTFWNWLPTLNPTEVLSSLRISTPLLSALDITSILNEHGAASQSQHHILSLLFENGIGELISPRSTAKQKDQLVSLLHGIFTISPPTRLRMFQRLLTAIDFSSLNHSAQYLFTLTSLILCHLVNWDEAGGPRSIVDVGLQWVTRQLSEKSSSGSDKEVPIKELS